MCRSVRPLPLNRDRIFYSKIHENRQRCVFQVYSFNHSIVLSSYSLLHVPAVTASHSVGAEIFGRD